MRELVKIDMTEYEIEPSVADNIRMIFAPMVEGLKRFEGDYDNVIALANKEITIDVCDKAKRLRLDIGKVRIEAEKARKKEKEQYLRGGRAVDGVNNILKFAIADKEEKLKEIETYYERIEQEKKEKTAESRREELDKYEFDHSKYDLVNMPDEIWDYTLDGVKARYEIEQEAIKKAEADRVAKEKAESEERARIEAENKKLKAEAEAREKQSEKERKEREKVEQEKERTHQEELRKEREAREKVEAETRKREEGERLKLKAEAEAQLKANQAPDKEKLLAFAEVLSSLKTPSMQSVKGRELMISVSTSIRSIVEHLIKSEKGL